MKSTSNFGLQKPEPLIDNINIEVLNGNMDIVDKGLVIYLGTTSGSANAYTITSDDVKALSEGLAISIKIHAASTAASTLNINGWGAKAIKKPGGADATNLKVGIYTLRYDGANFILQGDGASGNATASDLILNKTATTDAGEIVGTMPDIGPAEADTVNLTSQNQEYVIAYGRHSGLRKIKAAISGLIASVIKAGATVGGITGTFTADANASATDIITGKSAYVSGEKVLGSMSDLSAATYNAGEVIPSNGLLKFRIPYIGRYTPNTTIQAADSNFKPENIPLGMSIFGMAGTKPSGIPGARGMATISSGTLNFVYTGNGTTVPLYYITVSGLTFRPSVIIIMRSGTGVYAALQCVTYLKNPIAPGYREIALPFLGQNEYNTGEYSSNSNAYVNSTGFLLPVYNSNTVTNWEWIALA